MIRTNKFFSKLFKTRFAGGLPRIWFWSFIIVKDWKWRNNGIEINVLESHGRKKIIVWNGILGIAFNNWWSWRIESFCERFSELFTEETASNKLFSVFKGFAFVCVRNENRSVSILARLQLQFFLQYSPPFFPKVLFWLFVVVPPLTSTL